MGGVSKGTYWAAVFIWDLCILGLFTIAAGLIIFGKNSYKSLFHFTFFNLINFTSGTSLFHYQVFDTIVYDPEFINEKKCKI